MIKRNNIFLPLFWLIFVLAWWTNIYKTWEVIVNWELTKWEIIQYRESRKDGSTMYTPVVSYNCDWRNYTTSSDMSSSWKSYDVWEITNVYCNWDSFIFKGGFDKYFWFIFLIPWLIIMFFPLIVKIYKIRREKIKEELIRLWEYERLKVTYVWYNTSYSSGRKNPMYFLCNYHDEVTNKTYEFKSYNYWKTNLELYVKAWDERKVYFNRMIMNKYYVDQEDIPKEI